MVVLRISGVIVLALGQLIIAQIQGPTACLLDPIRGPCRAYLRRYFYNPVVNECREFFYSGCGGNENNYADKLSCESICLRRSTSNIGGGNTISLGVTINDPNQRPIDCRLPIDGGPCRGAFVRWAFNGAYCQEFVYGGCGGNWNRYETNIDCEQTCGGDSGIGGSRSQAIIANPNDGSTNSAPPNDWSQQTGATLGPVCSWPTNPGPCRAYFLKWSFQNGRCGEFVYGGCGGNSNRFDTQLECEQRCGIEFGNTIQNLAIVVGLPSPQWCPPSYQSQAPPLGCELQPITRSDGCHDYEIRCTEGACATNPCRSSQCEVCINDPVLCPPGSICIGYRCLVSEDCVRRASSPFGGLGKRQLDSPLLEESKSPCDGVLCPRGHHCRDGTGSPVCMPTEEESTTELPVFRDDDRISNGEDDSSCKSCGSCEYCVRDSASCDPSSDSSCGHRRCEKNRTCIAEECSKIDCGSHGEICDLLNGRVECFGFESTNDHLCRQKPVTNDDNLPPCSSTTNREENNRKAEVYFYNSTSGRCESGCEETRIRFSSYEECRIRCMRAEGQQSNI